MWNVDAGEVEVVFAEVDANGQRKTGKQHGRRRECDIERKSL